jgi:hypothetical protein
MTSACRSLAAIACAFWVSAVAYGQPPVTVHGPFSNPYGRSLEWLANPQVRAELKLTDEQLDQVEQARLEMRRKVRDLYRSKELNERDPRKRAQAYRERTQALSDEAEDKARAILSREQTDRLQQVIWQAQMELGSLGILGTLLDKDVSAKLSLSDEQRDQLRRKQPEVSEENNRKREAFRRQMLAETREKMFALLTVDQRKKLEVMLGQKFQLNPAAKDNAEGEASAKQANPKE